MSQTISHTPEPLTPEPPKGSLFIIFLIAVTDFMGLGILVPNLQFYIPDYQKNPLAVTLLFSVYALSQFVAAPVLGAISDRYGRRPVLVFSQCGSVAGYLVLALATQFHWPSVAVTMALVYAARIIDGISGGNISTAQAYVSDVTTAQTRAKGMGLLGAAFGIGFSFGAGLGGLLGEVHLSLPAYVAAAFSATAAIQTFLRLPESRIHKPAESGVWLHPSSLKPVLRQPVLVGLVGVGFLSMSAYLMMDSTIGLYLNKTMGATQGKLGLYFVFVGLVIIGIQGGLIGRLTKRFGEWKLCIAGLVLSGLGMAGFIAIQYWPGVLMVGLMGMIGALGRSLQQPTLSALVSHSSNPKEQGLAFGLFHGTSSLARVVGPVIAGLTYEQHPNLCYAAGGAVLASAGVWTAVLRCRSAAAKPTGAAAVQE